MPRGTITRRPDPEWVDLSGVKRRVTDRAHADHAGFVWDETRGGYEHVLTVIFALAEYDNVRAMIDTRMAPLLNDALGVDRDSAIAAAEAISAMPGVVKMGWGRLQTSPRRRTRDVR